MKYFITIIVAILLISGFIIWQGVYYPKSPGDLKTEKFLVKKGQGAKEIAEGLQQAGIIRYDFVFRIYASATKQSNSLKAGEYELSPSMTVVDIVNKMVSGDMIRKMFTVIDGWNLQGIGKRLEEKDLAILEQLLDLDNKEKEDGYFKKDFSVMSDKPDGSGLEGYLFPDTYEFSYDEKLEDVVRKMISNLAVKVQDLKISEGKTFFDIIRMASLIEKEVKTPEDMRMVSGVLWNRIESKMPLQVDALPETYNYKGLPASPICNPGIEAIKAATDPTENDYLYYLSTPEGETIFSKTLKEHNAAINKYLK